MAAKIKLPDDLNGSQIFNLLTELPKDFLDAGRQDNHPQGSRYMQAVESTLTEWGSTEDTNAYRKL